MIRATGQLIAIIVVVWTLVAWRHSVHTNQSFWGCLVSYDDWCEWPGDHP